MKQPRALVRGGDVWVLQPLGTRWMASFRMTPEANGPVVAELRVFASSDVDEDAPQTWGSVEAVPTGGLTWDLLRRARPLGAIKEARRALEGLAEAPPPSSMQLVADQGAGQWLELLFGACVRNAEFERDEVDALFARTYLQIAGLDPHNVYPELAARTGENKRTARMHIERARTNGLLGPAPGPLTAGGELTEAGVEALIQAVGKASQQEALQEFALDLDKWARGEYRL
jgi:hypothetical protein